MTILPKKRLSAAWTLHGFFALLAIFLLLIAWLVIFPWLSSTLDQLVMESLRHESWEIRQTVATFVDHRSQILQDYARLPQISNGLTRTVESGLTLQKTLASLPLLGSQCQLVLLDNQGQRIQATLAYPLFNYQQAPWFSQLVQGQLQNHIDISSDQENSFWQFATPVRAPGFRPGILVAELPIRELSNERQLFNGLEDGQLDIVYHNRTVAKFGHSFSKISASYDLDSPAITLVLHSDRFNLETPVRHMLLVFIASLVGLTLVLLVLAHRFNRVYFVRPIEQLRSHTRLFAEGIVDSPVPEEHPLQEIALLAEDFNSMVTQVEQREQALIESRDTLEERVLERTAELHQSKLALQNAYQSLEQLVEKRTRKIRQMQGQMLIQEKMASIGQLAAGVAHELNNPLNFVHTNFVALQQNVKDFLTLLTDYRQLTAQFELDPDDRNRLERVRNKEEELKLDFLLKDIEQLFRETGEGFERIQWIVQSMRNFSRVDQIGDYAEYDLNKGINATLIITRNEYKHHAEVKTELQDLPPLRCIPQQINQVLLNLIVNAAQAISSQQRAEPGEIRIRSWAENGEICFSVTDNGPGVPEAIRHRIFEPFFSTKEAGKGIGLGLSICYDIIVQKHGGSLTLSCGDPGGTCFMVRLPEKTEASEN